MTIYQFGNVVVVDNGQIGVIVKSWGSGLKTNGRSHDVYVRSYNGIKTYAEGDIQHFIYNKELNEEEMEHYDPS
jgi:hypothetical protein